MKQRNFVSKNSHNKSGAGAHEAKVGKRVKRSRTKKAWKKEVSKLF